VVSTVVLLHFYPQADHRHHFTADVAAKNLGWMKLQNDAASKKIPLLKIYAPANRRSTPLIGAAIVDLCG